jgi:hypothetical protein
MAESEEPVRIVLTADQRELIHRLSGQNIEAIELSEEEDTKGSGRLRLLWRLSAATGIPRQGWFKGDVADVAGDSPPPQPKST